MFVWDTSGYEGALVRQLVRTGFGDAPGTGLLVWVRRGREALSAMCYDLGTVTVPGLDIRRVSPELHDEVLHYFDLVAYADNPAWSDCYCMERLDPDFQQRSKAENRAARSELLRSAKANGLIARRLGRVVGWCHAAPKSELVNVDGHRDASLGAIVG